MGEFSVLHILREVIIIRIQELILTTCSAFCIVIIRCLTRSVHWAQILVSDLNAGIIQEYPHWYPIYLTEVKRFSSNSLIIKETPNAENSPWRCINSVNLLINSEPSSSQADLGYGEFLFIEWGLKPGILPLLNIAFEECSSLLRLSSWTNEKILGRRYLNAGNSCLDRWTIVPNALERFAHIKPYFFNSVLWIVD